MHYQSLFAGLREASLAPVWRSIAIILLAATWLLPNHVMPWLAFHADLWCAFVLILIGAYVISQTQAIPALPLPTITGLLLSLIPIAQYFNGQLPYAGQAWVCSAYLFGFAIAVYIGKVGASSKNSNFLHVFAIAIVLAAGASTLIQVYQWTGLTAGLGLTDIWIVESSGQRPAANLGQPNQLASLHLWGMLACLVLFSGGVISRRFSLCLLVLLVVGLALTQSRAGLLGLVVVLAAVACLQSSRSLALARFDALFIGLAYAAALFAQETLAQGLFLDNPLSLSGRSVNEKRPGAWLMFLDAALLRPWTGYGWFQGVSAHLAVAQRYVDVHGLYAQSHNLFIDFVLWIGLPAGIALSLGVLTWVVAALRRIRMQDQTAVLLLTMLLTIGIHAMVELPLHYGYFLWPAGIVVGMVDHMAGMPEFKVRWFNLKHALWGGLMTCLLACALALYDYLPIEAALVDLGLEHNQVIGPPAKVPKALIFDQLEDAAWLIQYQPRVGMSAEEMTRVKQVVTSYPSALFLTKYILSLALNEELAEARRWMIVTNAITATDWHEQQLVNWRLLQKKYPRLRELQWVMPVAAKREP